MLCSRIWLVRSCCWFIFYNSSYRFYSNSSFTRTCKEMFIWWNFLEGVSSTSALEHSEVKLWAVGDVKVFRHHLQDRGVYASLHKALHIMWLPIWTFYFNTMMINNNSVWHFLITGLFIIYRMYTVLSHVTQYNKKRPMCVSMWCKSLLSPRSQVVSQHLNNWCVFKDGRLQSISLAASQFSNWCLLDFSILLPSDPPVSRRSIETHRL